MSMQKRKKNPANCETTKYAMKDFSLLAQFRRAFAM